MPPKQLSKAEQKAKEKIAVDKTFGLKNKNKSKVVQKYIKSIQNNVHGAPKGGLEEKERKEKDAKAKEIQKAALMNSLFNMGTDKKGRAFDPVAKKAAKQAEEEALAAGKKLNDETRKAIIEGIANTIRLTNPKAGIRMSELGGHPIIQALKEKHADTFKTLSILLFMKANEKVFWIDDPDSGNPIVRCQEDVDAEVAPDERPIEEIIEEKRAALPPGGTPVTLETFKAWKQKREADRLAKVEEDRQAAKKAGTKGLVGLSGRDLFTFDASLFVDDDGAASADEYEERSEVEEEEEEAQGGEAAEGDEGEAEEGEDGGEEAADGEEAEACEGTGGARSSAEGAEDKSFKFQPPGREAKDTGAASSGGAINEQLFLDGGDLPDDLDDLDDDEDGK